MNEIIIGDKTYISAKRAAEITGYARDYVGQLCREGHVDAKMVGRSWYVYEPAIRAHRFGAGAVQTAQNEVSNADSSASGAQAGQMSQNAAAEEASAWPRPTYTAESPEMLPELTAPRLEELLPPAEETLTDMQAAWREWFQERQTEQQNELKTPEIESPEVIDERNEAYEAAHEAQKAPQAPVPAVEESDEVAIPLHHLEKEPAESAQAQFQAVQEEEVVPIRPIAPPPAPISASAAPVRAAHVDIAPRAIYEPAPVRYSAEQAAPIEHGKIVSERIVSQQASRKGKNKAKAQRSGSNAPIIAALTGLSLIAVAVAVIGTGYASRYLKTLPSRNNPAIQFLVGTRDFTRQ